MTQHLFSWYTTGFTTLIASYRTLLHRLEAQFAVRETFRHISEPLFQDNTPGGRVVGVFFRLGRGFFALLFYALISMLYLIITLLWAALPVLIVVSILGYLGGNTGPINSDSSDLTTFIEESL